MKFIIAVDCEGVACAVGSPQMVLNDSRNFAFACQQATREANAAARALFDSGAEQVIIWDAHSGGINLDYVDLDERCDIANGTGFAHRWPGLDESFAGVLLIGYHAMDSTPDAIMAHTMSSTMYQWMKVNDQPIGEIAIDAASAGEYGVPVIFVASDDKGVAEAQALIPGIGAVVTKQSHAWNAGISKHPIRVIKEIYAQVKESVKRRSDIQPFRFSSPLIFERRFKRIEPAQNAANDGTGWERVDAYTVRKTVASIRSIY